MSDPAYGWSHNKICFPVVKNWTFNPLNCVDTICTTYLNIKNLQFAKSVYFINTMEKVIKWLLAKSHSVAHQTVVFNYF